MTAYKVFRYPTGIDQEKKLDVQSLIYNSSNTGGVLTTYSSTAFQGTVAGFHWTIGNNINKYPFATNANATVAGTRSVAHGAAGQSSTTHGYATGSFIDPWPTTTNAISKFPFAIAGGTSTDVGDLTQSRHTYGGNSSTTHGYATGGHINSGIGLNTVDRFPFSSDTNASDVGDLTQGRLGRGHSSSTHGYNSGGLSGDMSVISISNVIDRFPFAAGGNSSDVGDLTGGLYRGGDHSSATHGYNSGGEEPGGWSSSINKFSFVTNGNASSIGNLLSADGGSGTSSAFSGYHAGGRPWYTVNTNIIEKFPFATDSNSSDVGDLTGETTGGAAGQQD